ncbi:MAG: hypothetical protein AABW89_01140 [Nanoarchaeota archaeon]
MAKLQKVVVVLLILTIVLSAMSVVFNLIIYKMSSDNSKYLKQTASSNFGNVGLVVESSNTQKGDSNG